MQSGGDEERNEGHGERRSVYCKDHDRNTNNITTLRSSTATMRWMIQIGLPLLMAFVGVFFSMMVSEIKDSMSEIKYDTRAMRDAMVISNERYIATATKVDQLQKDVHELKNQVKGLYGNGFRLE